MKDIGYYAGFLPPEKQQEIREADLPALVEALDELASDLNINHHLRSRIWVTKSLMSAGIMLNISDRDKLCVIRGLCDRVELKLMEAAK
jgi:hypothetical protein